MKPDIELHIDELVIHGIPAVDRQRVGEAVERELARLLSEREGAFGFGGDIHMDRLDGGSLSLISHCGGEKLGMEIARLLYGSLNAKMSNRSGSRAGGER